MTRQILERLLLVALPFIAYGAYLLVLRFAPTPPPGKRQHPWSWLFIAGLALFAASFIVWGFTEGEPTTGTYVAPHVVNGKVVPGYVVPDKKSQ
ncbi:MAG: hypothetical protein ISS15_10305 [Alphaproteobacteria bacterium]|nr:hypothetical protein [Alphaproteobacteria bacterium]MBL7098041.1 hypothetical protein [Alphaproteobacteria bacterium]